MKIPALALTMPELWSATSFEIHYIQPKSCKPFTMSFVKVWIHAVWATHGRKKLLSSTIRQEVFKHIYHNAKGKSILIDCVNGYDNHVHCLFLLKSTQNLSTVMQLLKGESAYWINKNKTITTDFAWQSRYYAVSVDDNHVKALRYYILNQEDHHRSKSFKDECLEFFNAYFEE